MAARHTWLFCGALACAAMQAPPLGSVNLVHALWAAWGSDSTPLAGVAAAACQACSDRGFTTVRVAASPFWPSQWALYMSNETAYWEAAVPFAEALSAGGCVAVYSLFWNIFALPDLYGEPLGALVAGARGDSSSRSFAASLRYIDAFVGRFAQSQSVAAWELTNEFNLLFDLDQSRLCVSCGGPGSPSERTKADNVSTDDGSALLTAWADRIRAADPLRRPVSSGHSLPRPAAEHLRASYLHPGSDWTEDTFAQFQTNFADISSCCEWASAHIYPGKDNARWGKTGDSDPSIVWYVQAAAAAARKTLMIGEFGQLPDPTASPGAPRPFVTGLLGALANPQPPGLAGVTSLALMWTWEFGNQNGTASNGWALWPGVTEGAIDSLMWYNGNRTLSRGGGAAAAALI